jgi:hypothetical protein
LCRRVQVTTTTPPEGRGTRIGDRTFVLTDDGLVLDAQTGAAASSDMATAVREKLNPSLTLDDIIGGQSQYDPTGGGVNPSYVEDGTRGTSTTSSGRGDPRDFGFVAEDAAASRPGMTTGTPLDISGGILSVLPPVTNTVGIVGEGASGTPLAPSYTENQVETILEASDAPSVLVPVRDLVDPISGDVVTALTFSGGQGRPAAYLSGAYLAGYQQGLRGEDLEGFVDEAVKSPDFSLIYPPPEGVSVGAGTTVVQPIDVEGTEGLSNLGTQPVNIVDPLSGMDFSLYDGGRIRKTVRFMARQLGGRRFSNCC